jgi:hypothetical protein
MVRPRSLAASICSSVSSAMDLAPSGDQLIAVIGHDPHRLAGI